MRADIAVLGAGIVGICVALHLQKRGRAVALLDRRGAAEETSFGNAGLIQREGVYPYGFPHDFGALLRYGFNRTIDAYYHPSALPRLAPFLLQYWRYSRPARHAEVARRYSKLIEHCVSEHEALADEAGASGFLHRTGWMKVFRTERERDLRFEEAARWKREFGINYRALDATRSAASWSRTWRRCWWARCTGPSRSASTIRTALALAYLAAFERLGGRFVQGNARAWKRTAPAGACARAQGDGLRARRGDRARALGRRADARARLRPAARGEARLPHALSRGGQARS